MPGSKAVSVILLYPRCLSGSNISSSMKSMLRTKSCRRTEILDHYIEDSQSILPKHDCCDNCARSCECEDCPISPLVKLGIVNEQNTEGDSDTTDIETYGVSDEDTDSDIEIFRRKPVIVLSDSD